MMKWIFGILMVLSVIFGFLNGRMEQVNTSAITECEKAIELTFTLMGTMCLWSGLMRVAKKASLTQKLAKLMSPIIGFIFKGLDKSSYAMELICMNVSANLLGLGNAATPLGIQAITELSKHSPSSCSETAADHMILLVVLNTASIQLIPTTVATLRLKYGASTPMDIVPAVWLTSGVTLFFTLILTKFLNKMLPIHRDKKNTDFSTKGGRS